jgi:hypothetical protein
MLPQVVASEERPLCRIGRSSSHHFLKVIYEENGAPVGKHIESYLQINLKINQIY